MSSCPSIAAAMPVRSAAALLAKRLPPRDAPYRVLFDGTADGVLAVDAEGRIIDANPAAASLLGCSVDALRRRPVQQLADRADDRARRLLETLASAGRAAGRIRLQAGDGRFFEADLTGSLCDPADGGAAALFVFRDAGARPMPGQAVARAQEQVLARSRELAMAREEIEALVASVSHDLRAPVALVRNFSHVLLQGCTLDAAARSHAGRIAAAADHMREIIEALLGLARIGNQPLQAGVVDVERLAREVADECAGASGRPVLVDIRVAARVVADPALLRVVLSNLIGNAWKFTGGLERPRIVVHCRRLPSGEVALGVSDNGAGFDCEQSEQMFRPFRRLHAAEQFPGLGIGLATVHRIVQRHGGRIEAEGRVGHGATFTVILPPHGPDLVLACRSCDARAGSCPANGGTGRPCVQVRRPGPAADLPRAAVPAAGCAG